MTFLLEKSLSRGTWVAELVEWQTLGFSSGRDHRIMRSSLTSGSTFYRTYYPTIAEHTFFSRMNETFSRMAIC